MVLPDRIELSTSPLPMECSTTELRQHARYVRIGPKGPYRRPVLATRTPLVQARGGAAKGPKRVKIGSSRRLLADPVPGLAEHRRKGRESLRFMPQIRSFCRCDRIRPPLVALRPEKRRLHRCAVRTTICSPDANTQQAHDEGCEGFATGAVEAGAARKSQAAKVAGARAQRRGGGIFRTGCRVPR